MCQAYNPLPSKSLCSHWEDKVKSAITASAQAAYWLVASWLAWAHCLWDCPSVKDVIYHMRNSSEMASQRKEWSSEQEILFVGVRATHTSLPRSPLLLPLWLNLCYCCLWVDLCPETCSKQGVAFFHWGSWWYHYPFPHSWLLAMRKGVWCFLHEPKRQNWEL